MRHFDKPAAPRSRSAAASSSSLLARSRPTREDGEVEQSCGRRSLNSISQPRGRGLGPGCRFRGAAASSSLRAPSTSFKTSSISAPRLMERWPEQSCWTGKGLLEGWMGWWMGLHPLPPPDPRSVADSPCRSQRPQNSSSSFPSPPPPPRLDEVRLPSRAAACVCVKRNEHRGAVEAVQGGMVDGRGAVDSQI